MIRLHIVSATFLPSFCIKLALHEWQKKRVSKQKRERERGRGRGRVVVCVKGTARITFMN